MNNYRQLTFAAAPNPDPSTEPSRAVPSLVALQIER